ncbi:MAG: sugar-binding protein [Lachnospiraceae bacterium]|nr:sugar-binding protein [Lachnospiraceae bacterium]
MKSKFVKTMVCAGMIGALLSGCGSSQTVEEAIPAAPGSQAVTETAAPETDEKTEEEETETTEAAGEDSASATGGLVGVAMPTKDLQRWNQDGTNIEAQLKEAGYEVDLQYASNDVQTQVSQIENMINNGCKCLVISAIDSESLGDVLAKAKEAGIYVIAYDRLIMNTDALSYYATFDNYKVGTVQGQYVVDQLDLDNAEGPFSIEMTAGDPGDNNAIVYYDGAMDVLKPYVESGKLVFKSGQDSFEDVATASWSTENAQSRAENILSSFYTSEPLDVWLCSNDSTALGVENALAANYTLDYPIITGQDCDVANTKNMIAGKQSMSVFKDTRQLASKTVEMVDAVMQGKEAEVNDTSSYDNGTGVIPSYLCEPVFADSTNYKELLIDSGYYSEDDLK